MNDSSPKKGSHEDWFRAALDQVSEGLADRLEYLGGHPEAVASAAVEVILGRACLAQNGNNILLGRAAASRIPQEVLSKLLPGAVARALNLNDEWEYRRLLELLEHVKSPLLAEYIRLGLASADPEIREAAQDMSDGLPAI